MKRVPYPLGVLALAVLVLTGCAIQQIEPEFEDSNQMLIEQTIEELDPAGGLRSVLPTSSKVCVVSLETDATRDHPVVGMVEDALVRSFRRHGYTVLERDDDILRRLAAENPGEGYRFVYLPSDKKTATVGSSRAGVGSVAANLWSEGMVGQTKATAVRVDDTRMTHESGGDRDSLLVLQTSLPTADYLVSYRVLECGIYGRRGSERSLKKREAAVRLHMRVQESETGEILYAENVRNEKTDEVKRVIAGDLRDFHYVFYSPDLPLVKGTPTDESPASVEPARGSGDGARRVFVLVLGALGTMILLLSL